MEKLNTFIRLLESVLNKLNNHSEDNGNFIDDNKFQLSREGSRQRILILLYVFAVMLNILASAKFCLLTIVVRETQFGTPVILTSISF